MSRYYTLYNQDKRYWRSISHAKRGLLLYCNTHTSPPPSIDVLRHGRIVATLTPHKTLSGYRIITKIL